MITGYEPGLDGPLVAGVDVGGTKISVVVTDARDRIFYEHVAPTDRSSLVDQIAGLVDEARRSWGGTSPRSASPSRAGSTRRPARSAWPSTSASATCRWVRCSRRPSGPDLRRTRRPRGGVLAERAGDRWLGSAPASVAFLAIGTGISAGVVLDGALLRGDNSFAGEVGHIAADPDGVLCACGLRGCLETIAAGPAIARQAAAAVAAGRTTVLSAQSSAADVFRAGSDGDEVALEITDRVADHLARAIRSLALTLGVKRIVIGGGVAAAGPALLEPIRSRILRECAASALVQAALEDATVELLSPTEAPGARGAAAIARQRIGPPEREGVGER